VLNLILLFYERRGMTKCHGLPLRKDLLLIVNKFYFFNFFCYILLLLHLILFLKRKPVEIRQIIHMRVKESIS